jgi:hypothetical protein
MLVAAVTALDVAFASAVAAIVVGIATPLSAWLIARGNNRTQRRSQAYSDMREAYVTQLRAMMRVRIDLRVLLRALENNDVEIYNRDRPKVIETADDAIERITLAGPLLTPMRWKRLFSG